MNTPYRRIATVFATAAGACAIAVPAAAGLSNNPTFSEHIRVPVPTAAHRVSFDHGTVREAGDDHGGTTRHRIRHIEPGDDHDHGHGHDDHRHGHDDHRHERH